MPAHRDSAHRSLPPCLFRSPPPLPCCVLFYTFSFVPSACFQSAADVLRRISATQNSDHVLTAANDSKVTATATATATAIPAVSHPAFTISPSSRRIPGGNNRTTMTPLGLGTPAPTRTATRGQVDELLSSSAGAKHPAAGVPSWDKRGEAVTNDMVGREGGKEKDAPCIAPRSACNQTAGRHMNENPRATAADTHDLQEGAAALRNISMVALKGTEAQGFSQDDALKGALAAIKALRNDSTASAEDVASVLSAADATATAAVAATAVAAGPSGGAVVDVDASDLQGAAMALRNISKVSIDPNSSVARRVSEEEEAFKGALVAIAGLRNDNAARPEDVASVLSVAAEATGAAAAAPAAASSGCIGMDANDAVAVAGGLVDVGGGDRLSYRFPSPSTAPEMDEREEKQVAFSPCWQVHLRSSI